MWAIVGCVASEEARLQSSGELEYISVEPLPPLKSEEKLGAHHQLLSWSSPEFFIATVVQ
jgi:hypothetical protein